MRENINIEQLLRNKKKKVGHFFGNEWYEDEEIFKRTANCEEYFDNVPVFALNKDIIQYEESYLKPDSFSVAFSHMLHHQVAIYEVFLAMYFRPTNFYCVHVDYKADGLIRQAVKRLVECYSNKTSTGKIFVLEKKDSINVNIHVFIHCS